MIKQGERVYIKPEWQDKGDDKLTWQAVEDEDGGRVKISPIDTGLKVAPVTVALTAWLYQ